MSLPPEVVVKLRRDLNDIRARLEELRDAIQEHSRTLGTDLEVHFNDETVRQTKAEHDRQYRTQNSLRKAAWCAFVAAVIYAGITALQYGEMRQATIATRGAADAATWAANVARDTFNLTQRPRLKILSVSPQVQTMVNGQLQTELDHGKLRVSIDVPNYGPFDARNVRFFRYDNVSIKNEAMPLQYEELKGEPKLLPPKSEGRFQSTMTITGGRTITPVELGGLKTGKLWATFSVLVVYDDDLGQTHHAEYCDMFTLQPYNDICPWPVRND